MIEVACVWAGVVLGLAYAYRHGDAWLGPVLLFAAATLPNTLAHRPMPRLIMGPDIRQDLKALIPWPICLLIAACVAGRLLAHAGLVAHQGRPAGVLAWLAWQSLAVAPSEEWFFRGYVQSLLADRCKRALAIIGSAALFGVSHLIVQGQFPALLTFLPGLVLGWLYAQTGTLLAPIVFHCLANLCWVLA
ncbi:MAG: CPBP family intramembrane metalloprotease [Sedimentisphaerales bacterium]|jgi:membrane protease YdiL (CAAX protease family)|nr:CPBP family intramembrane metalloprotease [Sedimentisphaerales bacterium]